MLFRIFHADVACSLPKLSSQDVSTFGKILDFLASHEGSQATQDVWRMCRGVGRMRQSFVFIARDSILESEL